MATQFTVEFEVRDGNVNLYQTFIFHLRQRLAVGTFTHGIARLTPAKDVPTRFFDLILRMNDDSVTFRLRMDNLYLIGYRMENKQWLEFNNRAHIHLITKPGTKLLGFDGGYTQLKCTAHVDRNDILIGFQALSNAIQQLATSEVGEARARSLMTVIVMFLEAIRLIAVQDYVAQHYVGGAQVHEHGENFRLMEQIHAWTHFSKAMFLMDALPKEGIVVR